MTSGQLREEILKRHLTQRQAAKLLGVSEEHLSRLLSDETKVLSDAMFGKFVRVFCPELYVCNPCEVQA